MASPVSPHTAQGLTQAMFGHTAVSGQQAPRPAFGCATDTVQFGASREENREVLDGLKADADSRKSGRKGRKEKKERDNGFGAGVRKSIKYGFGTMGLSVLAGLGLLVAAPFSVGLSAIPGIALLAGSPVAGFFGATFGFLKGLKFG